MLIFRTRKCPEDGRTIHYSIRGKGKGKVHLYSANMLPSAALSLQTGPAFSLGCSCQARAHAL